MISDTIEFYIASETLQNNFKSFNLKSYRIFWLLFFRVPWLSRNHGSLPLRPWSGRCGGVQRGGGHHHHHCGHHHHRGHQHHHCGHQHHHCGHQCQRSHRFHQVVISGVSGRLPESDNVEEFRQHLINKEDMVTEDDRRWTPGIESC